MLLHLLRFERNHLIMFRVLGFALATLLLPLTLWPSLIIAVCFAFTEGFNVAGFLRVTFWPYVLIYNFVDFADEVFEVKLPDLEFENDIARAQANLLAAVERLP